MDVPRKDFDGPEFYHPDAVQARYLYDKTRNPYTGEYLGRKEREARPDRAKRERENAYQPRASRAKRTPYIPKRSRVPEGEKRPEKKEETYAELDNIPDPMEGVFEKAFDVPEMEHPDHTPGNSVSKHEFLLGDPKTAIDVQKEKNPYEKKKDGEEEEEDEEEEPKVEKEPYMTKEYYMPGYVDTTPKKEYPPALQEFKDYIETIGDFEKHGMDDDVDYSPDMNIDIDTSDFGPDSSTFAPNTASFSPKANGKKDFKPKYDSFTPVNQYGGYKPAGQKYGNFKPATINTGGFKPKSISYGNFKPTLGDYSANVKPQMSNFGSHTNNYSAGIGMYNIP